MIYNSWLQTKYVLAEILAATQLTCFFAFLAWLGANSLGWALGFVAMGIAADAFRWLYRYDWDTRRFVPNDINVRSYLVKIEFLLTDDAAAQRVSGHYRKTVWTWCGVWFVLPISILLVNVVWGDEPFCANARALSIFDFVAAQLIENVRAHPHQLIEAGYSCRAVFIEFYYATFYYVLIIGISSYFILIGSLDVLNCPVQAVRKRRVPNLEGTLSDAELWRSVLFSVMTYACMFSLVSFFDVSFKSTSRSWNVHDSNFQLFMMMIAVGPGMLALFSIINSNYALCRAILFRRKSQRN